MNGKTRKLTLIWLASLAIVIAALPGSPVAAKNPTTFDFNKSLENWGSGADAANQYSLTLQHDVSPLGCAPIGCLPNGYANLKFTPASAGMGAWMIVKIPSVPTNGLENVMVSFDAKKTGKCNACELIAYVGAQEPLKAAHFVEALSPKDPPLNDNWQNYTYNTQIKTVEDGIVYLALGVRSIPEMRQAISSATGSVGFDNVTMVPYPAR
jgi:hypothetical protein